MTEIQKSVCGSSSSEPRQLPPPPLPDGTAVKERSSAWLSVLKGRMAQRGAQKGDPDKIKPLQDVQQQVA